MSKIYIIRSLTHSLPFRRSFLMTQQQVIALLQHLQQQHPQAFKRNFLFYSLIKTKGIMDEIKEGIPWVLALMIFYSSAIVLSEYSSSYWLNLNAFQHLGVGILIVTVAMWIYAPFVIWQIKHSSSSLYEQLKNTPLKLTVVIVLQVLNLLYIESTILQYVLFFFAASFGFVRLYKENMFLETATPEQYYTLQQIRRATFWAYKKQSTLKLRAKFKTSSELKQQQKYFNELYQSLKNYENKLCSSFKHTDIDSYIDDIK